MLSHFRTRAVLTSYPCGPDEIRCDTPSGTHDTPHALPDLIVSARASVPRERPRIRPRTRPWGYDDRDTADSSTATSDLVAAVRSIIQVGGRPIAAGSIDPSIDAVANRPGVDRGLTPSGRLSMPLAKRASRAGSSAGGMV